MSTFLIVHDKLAIFTEKKCVHRPAEVKST